MCPCGHAEQDTAHVLEECRNHQLLRKEVWLVPETLHSKLYGPPDSLQRTTHFISSAGLQVWKAIDKKKEEEEEEIIIGAQEPYLTGGRRQIQ